MTAKRQSWQGVRDQILADVLAGRYVPGDKLPRDTDLAEAFGCARATVQRAMQDLSDMGLIERRRRGGTRLRPDPITRATLNIPVVRHEIEAVGAVYDHRLISRSVKVAPPSILTALGMTPGHEMLHIEALHLADACPYMLEDRWISTLAAPEILNVDLTEISANEWLVLNKPCSRFDLDFFAMNADTCTARHLECDVGEALLSVDRTTWYGSEPVTAVRSTARPGYRLSTRIRGEA